MKLALQVMTEYWRVVKRISRHFHVRGVVRKVRCPLLEGPLARQPRKSFEINLTRRRRKDRFVWAALTHGNYLEASKREPAEVVTKKLLSHHLTTETDA